MYSGNPITGRRISSKTRYTAFKKPDFKVAGYRSRPDIKSASISGQNHGGLSKPDGYHGMGCFNIRLARYQEITWGHVRGHWHFWLDKYFLWLEPPSGSKHATSFINLGQRAFCCQLLKRTVVPRYRNIRISSVRLSNHVYYMLRYPDFLKSGYWGIRILKHLERWNILSDASICRRPVIGVPL